MDNINLTEKSAIVPVVKEIRSILDTARNNVAQQINNELLNTYWTLGASSVNTSSPVLKEQITESRHSEHYQKSLQKNLAKVFLCQIFSSCAAFIRLIKFNRQRLLN